MNVVGLVNTRRELLTISKVSNLNKKKSVIHSRNLLSKADDIVFLIYKII